MLETSTSDGMIWNYLSHKLKTPVNYRGYNLLEFILHLDGQVELKTFLLNQ